MTARYPRYCPRTTLAEFERADRLQQRGLLVALRLVRLSGWRIHHHDGEDLQHVVLDHVAKGADRVVEAAAVLNAKGFRHGDLDAANIKAVPQRLERRIGEPRVEDVLNRLLAHIVVDAEDRALGEMLEQCPVQRLSRLLIAAEWLLDDETRINVKTGLGQRGNDDAKQARRNREIVQRPLGAAKRLLQISKSPRIVIVAVHISQQPQQLGESGVVAAAVLLDAVLGARPQLLDRPTGLGDADDGDIHAFVGHEFQQSRKDLLEGEIAGSAEEDQCVGFGRLHRSSSWLFVNGTECNHTLARMANLGGARPFYRRRPGRQMRFVLTA